MIIISTPLTADNKQKIIPEDAHYRKWLSLLYSEQGLAPPSTSGPWSLDELFLILDRINPDTLSPAGQHLYTLINKEIGEPSQFVFSEHSALDFQLKLNIEGYAHVNSEDFSTSSDWIYNNKKRQPVLSMPLGLYLTDNFYGFIDLTWQHARYWGIDEDGQGIDNLYYKPALNSNLFTEILQTDFNIPARGYSSAGGSSWNLQFGRDTPNWGSARNGNLVLDGHLDYQDYLRFTTYNNILKWTTLVSFFDPPVWVGNNIIGAFNTPENIQDMVEYFVGHRIELRLLKSLTMSFTEGMMVNSNVFDPRYLNPFMIYHSWFMRPQSNSILSVEVEYTVLPGFIIYCQLVMDEFNTPAEKGAYPKAMGEILGSSYIRPLGKGYLAFYLEQAYTDPYLYLRDHVDFIIGQRRFSNNGGNIIHPEFLGFPYGGDAFIISLETEYLVPGQYSAGIKGIYLMHGETDMGTKWHPVSLLSPGETLFPRGIPEHRMVIGILGKWNILSWLTLYGEVDSIFCWNYRNITGNTTQDFQTVIGMSLEF